MKESNKKIDERKKKVLIKRLSLQINPSQISSDAPLIGRGIGLDSMGIHELVVGLEHEFDMAIDESKLKVDHLKNIRSLAEFISNQLTHS